MIAEQVLGIRLRRLGPTHPDTLWAMFTLANTLYTGSELAGARAWHEKVLSARRRELGAGHPDTLLSMTPSRMSSAIRASARRRGPSWKAGTLRDAGAAVSPGHSYRDGLPRLGPRHRPCSRVRGPGHPPGTGESPGLSSRRSRASPSFWASVGVALPARGMEGGHHRTRAVKRLSPTRPPGSASSWHESLAGGGSSGAGPSDVRGGGELDDRHLGGPRGEPLPAPRRRRYDGPDGHGHPTADARPADRASDNGGYVRLGPRLCN